MDGSKSLAFQHDLVRQRGLAHLIDLEVIDTLIDAAYACGPIATFQRSYFQTVLAVWQDEGGEG